MEEGVDFTGRGPGVGVIGSSDVEMFRLTQVPLCLQNIDQWSVCVRVCVCVWGGVLMHCRDSVCVTVCA